MLTNLRSPLSSGRRSRRALFGDRIAFLRGFIEQPREVASVLPSSHWLERQLMRAALAPRAQTAVELGPGTGGTTRALLRALPADARLLALEQSAQFRERLRECIADPRLVIPAGSAEHLAELLHELRLPPPDLVLSGIPFSTMPATASERIAKAVAACLAPGGRFVAYQVRGHVAGFVEPHLGAPQVQWQWLNVPPLRVYRWVKR